MQRELKPDLLAPGFTFFRCDDCELPSVYAEPAHLSLPSNP